MAVFSSSVSVFGAVGRVPVVVPVQVAFGVDVGVLKSARATFWSPGESVACARLAVSGRVVESADTITAMASSNTPAIIAIRFGCSLLRRRRGR